VVNPAWCKRSVSSEDRTMFCLYSGFEKVARMSCGSNLIAKIDNHHPLYGYKIRLIECATNTALWGGVVFFILSVL